MSMKLCQHAPPHSQAAIEGSNASGGINDREGVSLPSRRGAAWRGVAWRSAGTLPTGTRRARRNPAGIQTPGGGGGGNGEVFPGPLERPWKAVTSWSPLPIDFREWNRVEPNQPGPNTRPVAWAQSKSPAPPRHATMNHSSVSSREHGRIATLWP